MEASFIDIHSVSVAKPGTQHNSKVFGKSAVPRYCSEAVKKADTTRSAVASCDHGGTKSSLMFAGSVFEAEDVINPVNSGSPQVRSEAEIDDVKECKTDAKQQGRTPREDTTLSECARSKLADLRKHALTPPLCVAENGNTTRPYSTMDCALRGSTHKILLQHCKDRTRHQSTQIHDRAEFGITPLAVPISHSDHKDDLSNSANKSGRVSKKYLPVDVADDAPSKPTSISISSKDASCSKHYYDNAVQSKSSKDELSRTILEQFGDISLSDCSQKRHDLDGGLGDLKNTCIGEKDAIQADSRGLHDANDGHHNSRSGRGSGARNGTGFVQQNQQISATNGPGYPPVRLGKDEDDDEDESDNESGEEPDSPSSEERQTLACPFYAQLPQQFRKCSTQTFRDIPALKQHINRVHRKPKYYCGKCFERFSSQEKEKRHARQSRCKKKARDPLADRIPYDRCAPMDRRIRGRAIKEKWDSIYKVFFPNETPPISPFADDAIQQESVTDMANFLEYLSPQTVDCMIKDLQNRATFQQPLPERTRLVALKAIGRCVKGTPSEQKVWTNAQAQISSLPGLKPVENDDLEMAMQSDDANSTIYSHSPFATTPIDTNPIYQRHRVGLNASPISWSSASSSAMHSSLSKASTDRSFPQSTYGDLHLTSNPARGHDRPTASDNFPDVTSNGTEIHGYPASRTRTTLTTAGASDVQNAPHMHRPAYGSVNQHDALRTPAPWQNNTWPRGSYQPKLRPPIIDAFSSSPTGMHREQGQQPYISSTDQSSIQAPTQSNLNDSDNQIPSSSQLRRPPTSFLPSNSDQLQPGSGTSGRHWLPRQPPYSRRT